MINSVQGGKNYYYGQPGKDLANPDNIYQNNLFNFDYWTPENPNARYRQLGYYTQALGYTFSLMYNAASSVCRMLHCPIMYPPLS